MLTEDDQMPIGVQESGTVAVAMYPLSLTILEPNAT